MSEKIPKQPDRIKQLLVAISKAAIPILTVVRLLKDIFGGSK